MNFEVKTTPHFEKAAKALAKRHRSFKKDLGQLILSLSVNPLQGDELCPGVRKIRMAVTSKGKGKSGGARIITYTLFVTEVSGRVYLVEVYDKSDFSTVDVNALEKIVKELELQ